MTTQANTDGPVSGERMNWLTVVGARQNNLKNITVEIPLARFVCVTGVSGSGKSSLVNDILREALARDLNGAANVEPGEYDRIEGLEHLDKVIDIDQSPIGRTPRSNPATYIRVFDEIRDLYTRLPDARVRGYKPGRFSFNVHIGAKGGGRCEACEGNGSHRMEMELLADVWVTCPMCNGRRFSRETLQILYKGKSIADVLEMDVQQALTHFGNVPKIREMLQTLHDVGLDYLKLGQSSTTLSGGEAQRIKLARELVKKSTGRTLYILDEPTTGLHFADIKKLLAVLHGFVDAGNTVLVIEHNLDVIKTADWVIDLGPEGGDAGGTIVATGTPEQIVHCKESFTGEALREVLAATSKRPTIQTSKPTRSRLSNQRNGRDNGLPKNVIRVVGARQHNLKDITVDVPRGKTTVCCGPSGSGKTSFAVDTLYTEGQRRYVESLSAYARQFLGRLQPPKVDHVYGLSPAICIEQKNTTKSPRSTVGTITEIYDYLRVLWTRVGKPYCPKCRVPIGAQSSDEIVERILELGEGIRLLLLAPIQPSGAESYSHLLERERANGYARARIDGQLMALDEPIELDAGRRHRVELVVDRITARRSQISRITDSVEQALAVGQGVMIAAPHFDNEHASAGKSHRSLENPLTLPSPPEGERSSSAHLKRGAVPAIQNSRGLKAAARELRFSQHFACGQCGATYDELTPHHFSFNTRMGWCDACEGLGVQQGASPAAIVIHPTLSISKGAIAGWGDLDFNPVLRRLAQAVCDHIGIDIHRSWNTLGEPQQLAFLQGCGDEWIDVPDGLPSEKPGPVSSPAQTRPLRIQWRGFFPAIDRATRISRDYLRRLADLVTDVPCEACGGGRLKPEPASVRLSGCTIHEICVLPLGRALAWFEKLRLDDRDRKIAEELMHEITSRMRFLVDVGLNYLTLHRGAATLSGGEAQRIQLAAQIGTGLTGVLYVLDEPTIGLHPRDNRRLIGALRKLRDLGNTMLLVEHDREVIDAADHILDFGPGAGTLGGKITAQADPKSLRRKRDSLTGRYLSGRSAIPIPTNRRPVIEQDERQRWLTVHGARQHNLKEVDVAFPLSRFTCVTGVSGSGKSTLVTDILYNALAARIHRARLTPGGHDAITGVEHIDKVINVDQSPIGNSPTSNPATYTGVFDAIREVYARLPLSKVRGYTANRFSFNRPGGRCEACAGLGQRCIEMHFLPDVWIDCESCNGKRFLSETLEVHFRGKSIADVLAMSVREAADQFQNLPKIRNMLATLEDVGLGYVKLGQSAPTLSGGEAQRVKLAAELGRPSTGKTLYILDEPTTGLHFEDLRKLLDVLHRLVDLGNTVICIEHNLDVIKTADWVIDLGPEAGEAGGTIVVCGPPEIVSTADESFTGVALRPILEKDPRTDRPLPRTQLPSQVRLEEQPEPIDLGEQVKMPWEIDGEAWHIQNHVDHNGEPVAWEPDVLLWLEKQIQETEGFCPTSWSDRSKVEITAEKNGPWFCHFLTGFKDLLEVAFRAPHGSFRATDLQRSLRIKTLDERDDLPIYGQWSRIRVRRMKGVAGEWDDIRLSLRDFKDVNRRAFQRFLIDAARKYLDHIGRLQAEPDLRAPWKAQGQEWHLSRRGMSPRQKARWQPSLLPALVGRFKTLQRDLEVDWNTKTAVLLKEPGGRSYRAKIVTNMGRGLRVELRAARNMFTPAQVDKLGEDVQIRRRPGGDWIVFWVRSLNQVNVQQLHEVWRHPSTDGTDERLQSA